MTEDSTFNLSCSTGWKVGWDNPVVEERKDRNTGGFHYQYNILQKSDCLDRYPMCKASGMITNLGVTVFFMVVTFCFAAYGKVPAGFMIATLLFCVGGPDKKLYI